MKQKYSVDKLAHKLKTLHVTKAIGEFQLLSTPSH